jgi:hypothetical protein
MEFVGIWKGVVVRLFLWVRGGGFGFRRIIVVAFSVISEGVLAMGGCIWSSCFVAAGKIFG